METTLAARHGYAELAPELLQHILGQAGNDWRCALSVQDRCVGVHSSQAPALLQQTAEDLAPILAAAPRAAVHADLSTGQQAVGGGSLPGVAAGAVGPAVPHPAPGLCFLQRQEVGGGGAVDRRRAAGQHSGGTSGPCTGGDPMGASQPGPRGVCVEAVTSAHLCLLHATFPHALPHCCAHPAAHLQPSCLSAAAAAAATETLAHKTNPRLCGRAAAAGGPSH